MSDLAASSINSADRKLDGRRTRSHNLQQHFRDSSVASPHVDKPRANWIEKRFKYIAEVTRGRLPASNDFRPPEKDAIPYLTTEYLRGESDEPELVEIGKELVYADEGDTLLLWDGANAGEFFRAKQGAVSSTVAKIVPHKVDAGFLHWACKGREDFLRSQTTGMGIPHVDSESLTNMRIPLPGEISQHIIADYLDRETARLDTLIAAKQRMLRLLVEKQRAFITHAVTCGLHPSSPMQDSAISWLGEIPAHWQIWKIGHLAVVGNGSTPSRNNESYWADEGIPWLNSGVVNRPEITSADQFVTKLATRRCHLPMVGSGAVLIAITGQGKTRGRASILSIDATISQHLAFIQPRGRRLRPWFLRWVLVAAYDFLRSISDDAGGTKGALTCGQIANLRVPVPPLNEQDDILSQVTTAVAKMESSQSVVDRAISIIKERRAAVISNAVAGKLDLGSVT